jgi:hypothetical protein
VDGNNTVVDLVLDISAQPVFFATAQSVFVTNAWSHSDDFDHHSAQRTETTFEW